MPRMRTVREAIQSIKENDPNTSLSEHCIRLLMKQGKIPYIKSGRRFLINLDTLEEYLSNPTAFKPPQTQSKIKQIEV